MNFTFTTADPRRLAGITAARAAYNTALEVKRDEEGAELPIEERDGFLATDEEYVQFVMDNASLSYANQYGVPA